MITLNQTLNAIPSPWNVTECVFLKLLIFSKKGSKETILYFSSLDTVKSLSLQCKLDRNVWALKYKHNTKERLFFIISYKRQRKPKSQPRMNNLEKLATWDTHDTVRRQTKQKWWTTRTVLKHREVRGVLSKGKQFLLLIIHPQCYSYSQTV